MKEAAVQCEFKKEAVENFKQDNRVHSRMYFLGKNTIMCNVFFKNNQQVLCLNDELCSSYARALNFLNGDFSFRDLIKLQT